MTNNLEDEIREVLAQMEQGANEQQSQENPQTPPDEIQEIYVLMVRGHEEVEEDQPQIVDSTAVLPEKPRAVDSEPAKSSQTPPQPSDYVTLCIVLICCLPMLASIILQVYLLQNPPIATVTIIPKSQSVTLTGTLQLGRLLQPLAISQSQTVPTTGHGHQDARSATGYITFYNGELNTVTIAAGTLLTSSQGVQIATDQDATIPVADPTANPPAFGNVTVSAYAVSPGARGNIPAYDINQACCNASVIVKNTVAFKHGQDERDFSTVSQQDMNKLSTALKISLAQSMQGALQGQVNPNEQLYILPCTPTVTSDHQIGQEATRVKVTASEACSAVAYNSQELETKATAKLNTQALKKLGNGYSFLGMVRISVTQATIQKQVIVSYDAQGTWVYGLSKPTQERITHLLAGKTTQEAVQELSALPGVEQATIRFAGFADTSRLPKQSSLIHLAFIVM